MFFTAVINIDQDFVLACQYKPVLPVDNLLEHIMDKVGSVISQTLTELTVEIESSSVGEAERYIMSAWQQLYPDNEDDVSIDINESFNNKEAIMESIETSLVGWDAYKKLCEEITAVAPQIKKSGAERSFLFQNFLFSVNSGYGLSTALRKFAELVESLDLFSFTMEQPVIEIKLAGENSGNEYTIASAIDQLYEEECKRRLVCIDISNYLEKSKHNALKEFLLKLVPIEEDYIFAFSVPFLEQEALKDIRTVLADVLFVREIVVVPFNDEQLKQCAEYALNEFGYKMDEEALEVFFSRISEEKSDGRFYGIQTVRKIIYEMVWLKSKAAIYDNGSDPVITAGEISGLSESYKAKKKNGFDELESMVGMEEITARIKEIVAQVKLSMQTPGMERPCLHMRFVGAPGTGKTTVARLVGRIFRENGILRNGYFFEYSARNLCGEYVGQTAPKTSAICRDAYGSVLFIDEAYALYQGDGRTSDYGKEALTTLISEMETHRDDMVVIMAGYKEDMDVLMEANSGLRSRMPFKIEFKSYTSDELYEIFMLMVRKHFTYTEDFDAEVKNYFATLSEDYMKSKEFANARFVRNLYERTWSKAALRTSFTDDKVIVLTKEDFLAASGEKEFNEKLMMKRKLGF